MKTFHKFNINGKARVRLTDEGREILLKKAEDFRREYPQVKSSYSLPKEDKDGWSEWQMWALMQDFGPHIYLGGTPPFETEIEIEL